MIKRTYTKRDIEHMKKVIKGYNKYIRNKFIKRNKKIIDFIITSIMALILIAGFYGMMLKAFYPLY